MKAKNNIMTVNEMLADAEETKKNNHLYKSESMQLSDARISNTIKQVTAELRNSESTKISLSDTESVRNICYDYLGVCEESATFPTYTGLARALGVSRNALYDFKSRNTQHPTSRFLDQFNDLCLDVLNESALRKNCSEVVAIFLSKARYGLKDTTSLEVVNNDPMYQMPSIEVVEEKYSDLPIDDYEITE